MQFIDYNEYDSTLKKTSWDKSANEALIFDKHPKHHVTNFDLVEKAMGRIFHRDLRKSCDAYVEKNGKRYLIEFKNQSDTKVDATDIRNKIYESIALLALNENIPRELLAQQTVVIVVYNKKKHVQDKSTAAPAPSIDKLTKKLKSYANKRDLESYPKKFLVSSFSGKLIHNAYTVDVEDFQNEFMPMLFDE
ncbi:MAG: hypothetical protein V8R67_08750 [Eubacterium sp.]